MLLPRTSPQSSPPHEGAAQQERDGWQEQRRTASRRNVEFSGAVTKVLRRQRKRQHEEKIAASRWEEKNLVFPTAVGTLMTRHLIYKPFKRALRRADLPAHHGFGDLRHTFATLMYARGVHPKIVQEMMGHSSVKVTMDIDGQWIPGLHAGISDT